MKTMTNPTYTTSNPTNTDWVPTKGRRRSRSLWLAPLIMLIVLGIMALTGSFDLEHFDPTR